MLNFLRKCEQVGRLSKRQSGQKSSCPFHDSALCMLRILPHSRTVKKLQKNRCPSSTLIVVQAPETEPARLSSEKPHWYPAIYLPITSQRMHRAGLCPTIITAGPEAATGAPSTQVECTRDLTFTSLHVFLPIEDNYTSRRCRHILIRTNPLLPLRRVITTS